MGTLGVLTLAAAFSLSGCTSWTCTDTVAERGKAGAKVAVEDLSGHTRGVTAEVTEWRLAPHPQVPAEGDRVHFRYRFGGVDDERNGPVVDVCAVDGDRVALGCETVSSGEAWPGKDGSRTGDGWLAVGAPERVTGVLVIPNDRSYSPRTCAVDVKDGGGTHPPESAFVGDQL
ncbi:hypothetical protein AB0O07_33275 [Streptomyces sp. NPDC093085]|uniref:hypothetical protein n=1 Tax=Streptomyces sp. NPDC093085 TaxID=3155068 RepID=UPI00342DA26D